ncbi:pseudouridine synthase [uncultured Thermanaerothrix sp.]|uniref:pseudouridine synthase n=1 Tax=uncultured Thermanaerothrix sp. TaxID=1195149 RepID=UPI0026063067|nr:pseudouridine synthase [uncultured Thermanaerothrix sp.]
MSKPCVVIAFYKPDGVLSAFTDTAGRSTLKDYIHVPDVYPVGRLDLDSEGLLLLSNDGDLIHRLTHPRHHVPKTYLVQVEGIITPEAVAALQRGVVVKGRRTQRCQVVVIPEPALPPRQKPVTPHGPTSWLRIVLFEGMKRQIRHMTAAVGFPTLRLVRVAVGPITLEGLLPGQWRFLSPLEIERLQRVSR